MMDERKDARTDGQTDGRTWATLNALPHSTNSGGIKILIKSCLKTVCGDRFRTTGLAELDLDRRRMMEGGSNCNTGG